MSGTVVTNLDGPLSFSPFEIPDSSPPVRMALLRDEPSLRARTVVVEFPAGFRRPGPGCYVAAEELIVLSGTLNMGGSVFGPGDWGYVPPFANRVDTMVDEEVRVFARFSGPAKWLREDFHALPFEQTRLADAAALDVVDSEIGDARLLRAGENDSAWYVDAAPRGTAPRDLELFSMKSHDWAFVPRGEPIPPFDGPLFCRTFWV